MDHHSQSLFIGPMYMGSQVESVLEPKTVVLKETTAGGVAYFNSVESPPDCIVTDHDPPELDCFTVLEAVPSELPVVLAPTGGSSKLATQALKAGANTYIDTTTVENGAAAIAAEIERVTTSSPAEPTPNHELKKADERIEKFANMASHELRSPLQKITSSIALAQAECDSEYLDDIETTVDDIGQLVDTLLDQLHDGESTVEMTAVDLSSLVAGSWPDQTTAVLSVESELPTIKAERSRLRQLLTNLFQNSVDHSSENVTVRIGIIDSVDSDRSATTIGLYIADDGPGIEQAHRESVFNYGYTGSADGTGFGLAVVKEVVDAFDWEITVTESATGGARFEIRQIATI